MSKVAITARRLALAATYLRPILRTQLVRCAWFLAVLLMIYGTVGTISPRPDRPDGLLALICGLALAVLLTMVFLIPLVRLGRLPSGLTVNDWRASRMAKRQQQIEYALWQEEDRVRRAAMAQARRERRTASGQHGRPRPRHARDE